MALSEDQKKQKLKLILECLCSNLFDDAESGEIAKIGNGASPDPEWMDYVFWKNMSIDEAVEKAFQNKPINLGPPT